VIYDFLIVGAGFAGAVLAERLAKIGNKVLVVEKRNHIGGNAYDYWNKEHILVQKYGPHIFHTNIEEVWNYLCQFTEWNRYIHRVIAKTKGKEVYIPINLDTMERIYCRKFTPEELKDFFEKQKVKIDEIKNSRDVVISQIGEELYELFFKNYTKKQWGVYPEDLNPQVLNRLPIRFNRDTRYFTDKYQGMPKYGYSKMFSQMFNNRNIQILLNTDLKKIISKIKFNRIIYTGPIDYYFDYIYGKLSYRSLDFKFETLNLEKYQNSAVVNYPNDYNYTRITEFKHFYPQIYNNKMNKTTICYEFPKDEGDPYYPVPKRECEEIYFKYKNEIKKLKNVYFIGRLAQYKYLNMDQVVAEALKLFNRIRDGK